MRLLIPIGVVTVTVFQWLGDYWHSKWAVLLALLSFGVGAQLGRRTHWSAGLAFSYLCLGFIWVFAWRDNEFSNFEPLVATSFESLAASGLTAFLLLTFFMADLDEKSRAALRLGIALSGACAAIWIAMEFLLGARGNELHGPFSQASMTGCFLVMALPFSIYSNAKVSRAGLLPIAIAIIFITLIDGRASVPLLGATVCAVCWFLGSDRIAFFWRVVAVAIVIPLILVAGSFANHDLWNSSGRFEMYRRTMEWWSDNSLLAWGKGGGTFFIFGGHIQATTQTNASSRMIWLHSDWLQLVFEHGLIGLTLVTTMLCFALLAAFQKGRKDVVMGLLSYSAMAVVQYPVHLAAHALVGMFLISEAFQGRAE